MKYSSTAPVKILLIGAGGTGGYVIPHLYRLAYASGRPVRIIVCDGDIVEKKNLIRQNFVEQDIGRNKAQVQAERYSAAFGIECEYIPEFIESDERLLNLTKPDFSATPYNNIPETQRVILLGCVDNNRSRQMCHRIFQQQKDLVYIDSGNGEHTGQVVCGVRQKGRTTYKPVGSLYPDVLGEEDKFPSELSCAEKKAYPAQGEEKFRVALMDYGAKRNIIRSLQKRGCSVTVWPADTRAEDVLRDDPDGIMLSNGPGDPKENVFCIGEINKMLGQKPVFGICLGHQLTALALGGDTVKLKYGHRGGNQPVKDQAAGRTWITSQNHGYAVVAQSLRGVGQETFVNANDLSCEGMTYPDLKCFTVQFHPEACSGPRDTGFLFDRFTAMMGGESNA